MTLAAVLVLTACSTHDDNPADSWRQTLPESIRGLSGIEKFQMPTDYADASNWLNVPVKIDKDVDVFFIYPTCYMPANVTDPALCDIDNAGMREGAQRMFRIQASVFAESCNIFMPYYRQFSVPELAALGDDGVEEAFRYSASQDPTRALDYYFEHWNEGRPFIIAGHSQGSAIALMLLEDYFREHPDRYERMIAAYPIGYGVTPRDLQRFPHLKFAEGATDTGVIISWNTEGPQNNGHDNVVVKKNELCINPLNWRLDDTYAPITENLGSFNNNTEQLVPAMADARLNVSRGVVIVTTEQAANEAAIDASMQQFFGPQCYHGWDYGLFYMNLRQNIADRIVAWQTQHGEIPKAIQDVPGIEKFQTAVDYTDASNWLSLPATTDKAVDLFYLYPTAYTSPDLSAEAIASIDDKGMRSTATTNLSNNGPAFSDYCNVFAPFYREAGWLIDSVVFLRLMDRAEAANNKTILFTMGMYGCGKTTSLNNNPDLKKLVSEVGVVSEGAYNNVKYFDEMVAKSGNRDFEPHLIYVYNDAETGYTNCMERLIHSNRAATSRANMPTSCWSTRMC